MDAINGDGDGSSSSGSDVDDGLFAAFESEDNGSISTGDESKETKFVKNLQAENSALKDQVTRLQHVINRSQQIERSSRPLCHISFYDIESSRRYQETILGFLFDLAKADVSNDNHAKASEASIAAIVQQVQYYFCSDNLDRPDKYILDIMLSHDGGIPIDVLMSFRKIMLITTDRTTVISSLKRSPLLELYKNATCVRPIRRYSDAEARDSVLRPAENDNRNGDRSEEDDDEHESGFAQVTESMVVLTGACSIDRVGTVGGKSQEYAPLYEALTDVPLPHTHHGGQSVRLDRRCFNCGAENHTVSECPKPRDAERILANRQALVAVRGGNQPLVRAEVRYHVDEKAEKQQLFGHFRPGRVSDELREALGLQENDLPPWINRMWIYGYPPGYLDKADAHNTAEDDDDEDDNSLTVHGLDSVSSFGKDPVQKQTVLPKNSLSSTPNHYSTPPRRPPSLLAGGTPRVEFEGYNIPPRPGVVINDPRNPFSSTYDSRRQMHWQLQVQAVHSKAAFLEHSRGLRALASPISMYNTLKRRPAEPLSDSVHVDHKRPRLEERQLPDNNHHAHAQVDMDLSN